MRTSKSIDTTNQFLFFSETGQYDQTEHWKRTTSSKMLMSIRSPSSKQETFLQSH